MTHVSGLIAGSLLGLSAAVSAAPGAPNTVVADGIEIHFGLMPAARLLGYAAGSPEARMHGGVPTAAGYYHLNVSLFDASRRVRITDARVRVQVDEPGMGARSQALEPMVINGTTSYGNYVHLRARTAYWFTVQVQRPGYSTVTEAKFRNGVD